ncbi:LOW QUALITY PROTEIN: cytosolic beta-glucosidase-like [Eudromia elegans]
MSDTSTNYIDQIHQTTTLAFRVTEQDGGRDKVMHQSNRDQPRSVQAHGDRQQRTAKNYQGVLKTDDQCAISFCANTIQASVVACRIIKALSGTESGATVEFGTLPSWCPDDIAFPIGFAGAATAVYQIERGWNTDGKGLNVWDTFTHQGRDRVFKNQTGDVACGSYTLWEEDLNCIKQLGLTHYRFSLSWSRLLPDGTTGFINQKGISYYKIINDHLANGVLPMVTVYCFDLVQPLKDETEQIMDSSWPLAAGSSWLAIVPCNFHDLPSYIKDTYNNPIIYITENGFSQSDLAQLDDCQRWQYLRLILQEILKGTI